MKLNHSRQTIIATVLILLLAVARSSVGHPHHESNSHGGQVRQPRIPMRVTRPQREAPDNQTQPLDVGTRPEIPPDERVTVNVRVVDTETRQLLPHRVHIDDTGGTYYPPHGHFDIEPARGNTSNVTLEPDTVNDGYDWAMIPEGQFSVDLPARDAIHFKIAHGLEYPLATYKLDLTGKAGQTVTREFALRRGLNMRELGWMAADTHVHNLTPRGAIRQMPVEAIDYVNLMFIGPRHALLRRDYLTGRPASVSTDDHIVYVSQEVRDANQGHMTLIGMQMPIDPIRVYTGSSLRQELKAIPNEPLNWEVHERMHAQGGLAYHAHYLYWPGFGSAVGAAIDRLDGLEWLQSDFVSRGDRTRHNIEVAGYGRRAAGVMWYDMLNCGARLPLIGGTDKMSAGRVLGGTCRTYTKVNDWSHDGFLDGLRRGETFVTNGPLLSFSANERPIGSDIEFQGQGPFEVRVDAGCFTHRPIKFLEIIVNGSVVARLDAEPGKKQMRLQKVLEFSRSGWIAVRARHDEPDPDNWHHTVTAAHSSPIYISIDEQLPAVEASAKYMVARLQRTREWAQMDAIWSTDDYKHKALSAIAAAEKFYADALQRARSADR